MNVYNNDIVALERAVLERLLYVKGPDGSFVEPPIPDSQAFNQLLDYETKFMTGHGLVTAPMSKDDFLSSYVGRKRTIYSNAFESLLRKPLKKDDAGINYFIKMEKTNFSIKKDPVPRGISPRSPRYHVSVGLFIKRIEKLIYKRIDEMWGSPTIMKGKNALQRGSAVKLHWSKYAEPVAVGIDASRFDQHVHEDALKWEHSIYLSYFKGHYRKQLARMLLWQIVNKGYGRVQNGKIKFEVRGKRMSGDMNTALGNCLLMSTMVHSIKRRYNISCSFINDGDDGVIFLEKRDLHRLLKVLPAECLKFGHEVVLEDPVREIEHIEFCQCKFVYRDEQTLVAVRNVTNSFNKDSMCLDPLNHEKFAKKWMRSVGDCGLSLTTGLPVLQWYYQHFREQSPVGVKELRFEGFKMLAKGMGTPKFSPVTAYARYSFWKAFGIPPDKQEEMELYYANLTTVCKVATNELYFQKPHNIML